MIARQLITVNDAVMRKVLCTTAERTRAYNAAIEKARCYGCIPAADIGIEQDGATGEDVGTTIETEDRYASLRGMLKSITRRIDHCLENDRITREDAQEILNRIESTLDCIPEHQPLHIAAQYEVSNRNITFTVQLLDNSYHLWCVQHLGSGHYFHTFADLAAYCERRGWDLKGLTADDLYKKAMITGK